ncbi:Putative GATA transcription factor 22 [Apostasia shenzhenica]|uniref:GATA transcription factor 22 n=1 Tax=Apostasia shenzhenica TaxID=1088818 RepID=A0A2I0AP23_9ASPA|nr:Putative GATA transcription factor 22 [Apostasia shenzhenica]
MSSKMRLMRRMMTGTSDHHLIAHELTEERSRRRRSGRLTITNESKIETRDDQSHVMSMIRTCSHCSTTTTPLWRSGPRGPKSLCNACGIRQMKARRALADHEQGSGAAEKMKKASRKEKIMIIRSSELDRVVPYKKRFRYFMNHAGDHDHDHDQDQDQENEKMMKKMKIRKSSPAAFHSAFPQDEKEAAVLLMALSCGMIHG